MTPFDYVLTFVSILIGLGLTALLEGVGSSIRARDSVNEYWVQSVWVAAFLLFYLQVWFAAWKYKKKGDQEFTIWAFFSAILSPLALLLAAMLIYPPFVGEAVDVRAHYYEVRLALFLLLAVPLPIAFAHAKLVADEPAMSWKNAFRAIGTLLLLGSAFTANPTFHEVAALASAVLLLIFTLLSPPLKPHDT